MNPPSWRGRVVFAFGGWLVLWLVLLVLDYDVNGPILGGVIFASLTVWWLVMDTSLTAMPSGWADHDSLDSSVRPLAAVSRLEQRISETAEPHLMADETHRNLRLVVTRRLRSTYGVDLATQPDEARRLVGSDVYDYLTRPVRPAGRGFAHRMSAIVDRIEEL